MPGKPVTSCTSLLVRRGSIAGSAVQVCFKAHFREGGNAIFCGMSRPAATTALIRINGVIAGRVAYDKHIGSSEPQYWRIGFIEVPYEKRILSHLLHGGALRSMS